jgi:hypothetical protein
MVDCRTKLFIINCRNFVKPYKLYIDWFYYADEIFILFIKIQTTVQISCAYKFCINADRNLLSPAVSTQGNYNQ